MKLNIAELNTEGIKKSIQIDLGAGDYYEIPLENNLDYIEHKRKRNKKTYERLGYEYER